MADDNESQYGPYKSQDEQYADLIGNLLNPSAATPAGPNTTPAPAPAQKPPAPSPAGVTRSGDPSAQNSKTWADYVRGSLDRATAAQDQSQAAVSTLQNQPSIENTNSPLMQQRTQLAQPIDPNQAQYKPGIGTRIMRGIDAVRKGGVLALADPASAGAEAYGAPNRQYGRDTAMNQGKVAALDTEMKGNVDASKADSERLGKIGTEERGNATAALDVARAATAQQGAEDKTDQNTAMDKLRQERDQAKADKLPTTYEGTVVAAAVEQDPQRKAALQSAAMQMRDTEIKKFAYAARASGGGGDQDRRQPMIDAATAKVEKLNTYQFDSDANDGKGGFYDNANPNRVYTPEEFTAMKNEISGQLDKELAKAKLRPLGVRFGVQATTPRAGADGSLLPPGGAQPAQAQPAATAKQQVAIQDGGGKQLTDQGMARQYLAKAGGDKDKARQLAQKDNWKF